MQMQTMLQRYKLLGPLGDLPYLEEYEALDRVGYAGHRPELIQLSHHQKYNPQLYHEFPHEGWMEFSDLVEGVNHLFYKVEKHG